MLNIKKALTELSEKIAGLRNNGPIIKDYTKTYNIDAMTSILIDIPITVPDGYKFGLAVLTSTSQSGVLARDVLFQESGGTHIRLYVDNVKTIARTNCLAMVRVMYLPITWGGVISYLLHLTESLKSFIGRRWAYAEPQEIADEAMRTGELSNSIDNIEPGWYSGIQHEVGLLSAPVIWHGDSGHRLLYRWSYAGIALQCISRAKRGILRDKKLWNYRINKHNHTSALSRSGLTFIPREGVIAC